MMAHDFFLDGLLRWRSSLGGNARESGLQRASVRLQANENVKMIVGDVLSWKNALTARLRG